VQPFASGQVVVELKPKESINKVNADYGTRTLDRISDSSDVYLLELRSGSSVKKTVRRMSNDTRLIHPEPNFVIQPLEGGARHRAWGESDVASSSQEYAASALNLSIAQAISQGEGATVAVLDTGVQGDHPALKDSLQGVASYDFVDDDADSSERRVGADTDENGYEDQLVGHGTHVAGIVHFVAPEAKIMPLRVLDTEGYGEAFTVAKAVNYAERYGADVVNLSLGSPSRSKILRNAIKDATKNDVLVAAAAGNANSSEPNYPAANDSDVDAVETEDAVNGLVAVTSINEAEQKSDFANYGSWVDVAAPGERIRSALPVSKYAYWSGTSMATPFVSGQAALIHALYGSSLDAAGVEEKIRCTARSLDETNPSYVGMLGSGLANVGASLAPGACDTTAPETTITDGPSGLTDSASPAFAFSSSEAGSSFECKLDGEAYASCLSPQVYADLAEGPHTFYVRATDVAGNTDASLAEHSFTVDPIAPNTFIDSGPEGPTNDDTPSYGWSGNDNLTTGGDLLYSWRLNNGKWSTYSGATSVTLGGADGLDDGSYSFRVRARDEAGNVDEIPAERSFTVKTVAP
jgi:Subtilase family